MLDNYRRRRAEAPLERANSDIADEETEEGSSVDSDIEIIEA